MVGYLADKAGIDRQLIYEQSLITGSCGTGTLEPARAKLVFEMTGALSEALRGKHA